MAPLILLLALIVIPVVLLMVLRVNAAIVFLSLCLGSVLVRFAGSDAQSFVNLLSSNKSVSGYVVLLALLLLPAISTTLVMVGTVRGSTGHILNLLPALAVGLLTVLLVVPELSPGTYYAITGTKEWHYILRAEVLVITVGAILSILFLWMQRPKHGGHDKHGRHH